MRWRYSSNPILIICLLQQRNSSIAFTLPRLSHHARSTPSTTNTRFVTSKQNQDTTTDECMRLTTVGKLVGRGSYGTVHICNIINDDNEQQNDGGESQQQMMMMQVIGKRAWNKEDLIRMSSRGDDDNTSSSSSVDEKFFADKANRCKKYLNVEKHCLNKLQRLRDDAKSNSRKSDDDDADAPPSWQLPELVGSFIDSESNEWAAFSFISNNSGDEGSSSSSSNNENPNNAKAPAMSLSDAITLEKWGEVDVNMPRTHRLSIVQRALGLEDEVGFDGTLDHILQSLLRVVSCVHRGNVVHRDIKPDNLLLDPASKVRTYIYIWWLFAFLMVFVCLKKKT